jgi:hypothetical protein
MSILSGTGRIVLVREPVSGRFGLPRLLAKVSANAFRTNWHGTEEISVIVFNRKMTIAKILHVDQYGVDLTSRQLNQGRFKIMLEEGLLPKSLNREELERLLNGEELAGMSKESNAEKADRQVKDYQNQQHRQNWEAA